MRTTVAKTFSFDAAHRLPGYNGPCANFHGHTYRCTLMVQGEVDPATKMVIDFTELKELTEFVKKRFDHQDLNNYFPYPTVENIASFIVEALSGKLTRPDLLVGIRMWETDTSWCEVWAG